ncbi:MAG: alpha/beta hydrolase [Anaerolineales bacterium]
MSSITTNQGVLHYEVYGRGDPVILLHGWLGSWGLWHETMKYLGKHYRTYALDFWGFGESGKKRDTYAIQDFVQMVEQFMETMGIYNSPLVGHSMGGTVSLSVAIRYPERVTRVAVIGSPINGSSLALMLKLAGYPWIAALVFKLMWALRLGIRISSPLITKDPLWPEMIDRDLSRTTLESFLMSIASLRNTDLTSYLSQINVPVMGMYGKKDVIVNPKQWKLIKTHLPNSHIEWFMNAGHFIMLDEQEKFIRSLREFLDNSKSHQSVNQPALAWSTQ